MSTAVRDLFGRIAGRYDLLNRVLSARRDVAWRRSALAMVEGSPGRVLDLACGTFDLALSALDQGKAAQVHACDFCQPMLLAGTAKRAGRACTATVGDALHLPYASGAFDFAMIAYGWRNLDDPAAGLRELRRVLAPGGQLLILEFFRPASWFPRAFYSGFARWTFPLVGGLVGGDRAAYRYLHDSVQRFLTAAEADALLRRSGFARPRWRSFFGGVSHAVVAAVGDA